MLNNMRVIAPVVVLLLVLDGLAAYSFWPGSTAKLPAALPPLLYNDSQSNWTESMGTLYQFKQLELYTQTYVPLSDFSGAIGVMINVASY